MMSNAIYIMPMGILAKKHTYIHTYSEEREGEKKQIDFLRIYLVDCQTKGAEQVIFGKKKKN